MTRTLGDAFVRVRPDTSTFGPELNQGVDAAQAGVGSRMTKFAKVAGAALGTGAVLGAAAFAKGAVRLEADFGKTMNVLQATTKAPQEDMRKLSALAMKMGADTVFSANDASKAMLELARGGMNAAKIQGGALQGTLTLAAAGELSMSEAANIAVKSMGQFNLGAEKSSAVAAALAGAANASSASVRDMSFALAQGGLAAASVGFSIQETTGILAAFSNNGLEGSDAGTSLKTAMDRLVPTTETASKAMRALGIITKDGRNQFLLANGEYKSAAQIAGVLQKVTEDLSASERKAAISKVFGSDAQRAATILAKEGAAGIREMTKATSDQAAAEKMAAANMKGTSGALEAMNGSVETAQLAWGRAQKPIIMFGAQLITSIANGAVPIIDDFGRLLRRTLGDLDLDFGAVTKRIQQIDLGAVFAKVSDAVRSVDWTSVGEGFTKIGESLRSSSPELKAASDELPTFADGLNLTKIAIKLFAKHADTLAKALPYLALGFVAVKAAQAAANTAALLSVPVRIAEVLAMRAQTKALGAHAAAMGASTIATGASNAVTATGTTLTVRDRIARIAHAVASKAAAVATGVWTVAQKALNIALRMNPIGLVITALVALGAGLVLAYRKSETFRNIVKGAFHAVATAGRWLWNEVLQPVFSFLVKGFAEVMDMYAKMLRGLSKVPGFGWAEGAAEKMGDAADKARNLAEGIRKIPEEKNVKIKVHALYSRQFGTATPTEARAAGLGGRGGSGVVGAVGGDINKFATEVSDKVKKSLLSSMRGMLGRKGSVLPKGSYSIGMPYLGYPGHYGADYPAATGTPVFAAGAGRVSRALSLATSYGKHAYLSHPGGVETRYAHMSSLLVRAGQIVRAGQQIGTVGSTGNSSGPHLHFEYRRNGAPVNPATLGIFDRGGLARGRGYMAKDIVKPERVLSPRQTEAFEELVDLLKGGNGSGGLRPLEVHLKAYSDRFSLRQVMDELALRGAG